ncbi:Fam65a [Acrasis kona]|uniref:Fam65a n=1 Tax=Acrasis kona TaxID=1008807 RepID=A0AAW2YIN6_9EUKA
MRVKLLFDKSSVDSDDEDTRKEKSRSWFVISQESKTVEDLEDAVLESYKHILSGKIKKLKFAMDGFGLRSDHDIKGLIQEGDLLKVKIIKKKTKRRKHDSSDEEKPKKKKRKLEVSEESSSDESESSDEEEGPLEIKTTKATTAIDNETPPQSHNPLSHVHKISTPVSHIFKQHSSTPNEVEPTPSTQTKSRHRRRRNNKNEKKIVEPVQNIKSVVDTSTVSTCALVEQPPSVDSTTREDDQVPNPSTKSYSNQNPLPYDRKANKTNRVVNPLASSSAPTHHSQSLIIPGRTQNTNKSNWSPPYKKDSNSSNEQEEHTEEGQDAEDGYAYFHEYSEEDFQKCAPIESLKDGDMLLIKQVLLSESGPVISRIFASVSTTQIPNTFNVTKYFDDYESETTILTLEQIKKNARLYIMD